MAIRVTGEPTPGALPVAGFAARGVFASGVSPNLAAVCFPLAQSSMHPALLMIAFLIVVGFLLLRLQKRTGQASAPPSYRQAQSGDAPSYRRREPSTRSDQWEVEMHEFARELTARIDSKLAALQQLVLMIDERMASLDEKLARLDALLQTGGPGQSAPPTAAAAPHAANAPPGQPVPEPTATEQRAPEQAAPGGDTSPTSSESRSEDVPPQPGAGD